MLKPILVAVCTLAPTFRQKLVDLLLVSADHVPDVPSDMPASDYKSAEEEEKQTAGSKRALPRYATCATCRKDFDVTENTEKSCTYRSGMWTYRPDGDYLDPDFFVDHDEDCHGPMDSDENRRGFPEAFIYECCEGSGIDPCTTGWHREAQPKRTRVD